MTTAAKFIHWLNNQPSEWVQEHAGHIVAFHSFKEFLISDPDAPDVDEIISLMHQKPEGFYILGKVPGLTVKNRQNIIMHHLKDLSEDERVEVFSNFCMHCGSDNPSCQCWNDE